jgi:hypothetical protein
LTLLRITYRLRAHHVPQFEKIFAEEIVPLILEYGLNFQGIWRTLVGEVGEYMELWQFASMADFEARWLGFLNDPRLQKIFERTGPMVEGERFTLLEPVLSLPQERDGH